ncbi:MAG TPA: hypothetical protein VGJ72_11125 [Polaromonas sp.]
MSALRTAGRWLARHPMLLGGLLLAALLVPPLRGALESRMSTHMLLQFPVLIMAGGLLVHRVSSAWRQRLPAWNAHGIAGLTFAGLVLALAMVPRLLDLVLVDARIEALKVAALLLCGAALRLSWQAAGAVVQGFFLGNTLPMMAIAGTLYLEAPARVCNAYRLDEQQFVGLALIWVAGTLAALWLAQVGWRLTRPPPPASPSAM